MPRTKIRVLGTLRFSGDEGLRYSIPLAQAVWESFVPEAMRRAASGPFVTDLTELRPGVSPDVTKIQATSASALRLRV